MKQYLKEYARFTTIAEMDAAAEQHVLHNWDAMTKSDRQVLDVIRRYSVKYGAAHLKHATIKDVTGKSNVTVRRAIRKLVALQIIEKVHFIRPVMSGLGANIYIILPFDDQGKMNDRDDSDKPHDENKSAGRLLRGDRHKTKMRRGAFCHRAALTYDPEPLAPGAGRKQT
ncbi:phage like protein [Bacillus sp. OxB-1]|uniref:hypothetical protein n=1 Tax=Bacillus sp. (strain OxB-1) TaxID=98228 RepID=UPI000581C2D0|nr:hypothetical protein [Bacillus sp. OxB-1]BAQ11829.1 phage like protein [Bacillus sp. OxB-1]